MKKIFGHVTPHIRENTVYNQNKNIFPESETYTEISLNHEDDGVKF